jgi:hypothetical protein
MPGQAYQDGTLPIEHRIEDLLPRLNLADKVGLMFHTMAVPIPSGEGGAQGSGYSPRRSKTWAAGPKKSTTRPTPTLR